MLRRAQQNEFGKSEVARIFFEEALRQGVPPQSIFAWLYLLELEGGSPYAVTLEGNKTRSYGPWQINDARAEGVRKLGLRFPDDIYATRKMTPKEIHNRMMNHIRYIIEQDKQIRAALQKYNPEAYKTIFGKSMGELSLRELAYLTGYYMASWNAPAFAQRVAKGDFRPLVPGVAVYRLADFKRRHEAFTNALRNWEQLTSQFIARQREAAKKGFELAIYDALNMPTIQQRTQRAPLPAMPYEELRLALMPGLVQTLNALPQAIQMALPEAIEEAKKHFVGMENLLPADKAKQVPYATALALIGAIRRQDSAFSTAWELLPDAKRRKILDTIVHWSEKLQKVKDEAQRQRLETDAINEIAQSIYPEPLSSEYFRTIAKTVWQHVRDFAAGFLKEIAAEPAAITAAAFKRKEWQQAVAELDRRAKTAKGVDKRAIEIAQSALQRNPLVSFLWGGVVKGFFHMVGSLILGAARRVVEGNVLFPVPFQLPFQYPGQEKLQEAITNAMLWLDKQLGPTLVSESERLAEDSEFRKQHLKEAVMFLASSGLKRMLRLVGNRYEPTNEGWNLYASTVLQSRVWQHLNSVLQKYAKDHWSLRIPAEANLMDFRNLGPILGISAATRLLGLAGRAALVAGRTMKAEEALASMSILAETRNMEAALKLAGGLANLSARQRLFQRIIGTLEAIITPGSAAEKLLHRLFLNSELKRIGIDGIRGLEAIAKNAGANAALAVVKDVAPRVLAKSRLASAFITGYAYTWAGMPTHLEGPEAIGNFLGSWLVNTFLDAPRLYHGVVDLIKGKTKHPHQILSDPIFSDVIAKIYQEGFVKYMMQDPTVLKTNIDAQIANTLVALSDLNALSRIAKSRNLDKITLVLNIPTEKELRISRHIDTSFKDAIASLPDRERKLIERMIEAFKLFEDAKKDARRRKKVPAELSKPANMSEAEWFQYIVDSWVRRMSNNKTWGRKEIHPKDIARSLAALHILTHARWFGEYFAKDDPAVAQKMFSTIISYGLRAIEEAEKKVGEIETKDPTEAATKAKEISDEFLKVFYGGFPLFTDLFKSYMAHKLTLFAAAAIAQSGGALKDTEETLQVKLTAANSKMLHTFITNLPKFMMRFMSGEKHQDLIKHWEETVEPVMQAIISDIVEPSKIVDIAKNVVADRLRLSRQRTEITPWREIVRNLKALEAALKAEQQERQSQEAKENEAVAQLMSADFPETAEVLSEAWTREEIPLVVMSLWGEDFIPAPTDTSTLVPLVAVEPNREWRKVWSASQPNNPEMAEEARRTWDAAIRSFALSLLLPPEISGHYISDKSNFPILTIVPARTAIKIRQIPEVTTEFHLIAVDAGSAGKRAPDQTDEVILIWANKTHWDEASARRLGVAIRDVLWKEKIPGEFWKFVAELWSAVPVENIPIHIKALLVSLAAFDQFPDFFKKRMGLDTPEFDNIREFLSQNWEQFVTPETDEYLNTTINAINDAYKGGMAIVDKQFLSRFSNALLLGKKIGLPDLEENVGIAALFMSLSPFATLEQQYKRLRPIAFLFADHFIPVGRRGIFEETMETLRTSKLEPSLAARFGNRFVYVRNGDWDFKVSEDGTHWVITIPKEEERLFWAYYAARLQHATAFFDARHITATPKEKGTHKLFDFSPGAIFVEFLRLRAPSDKMGEFIGKFEEEWEGSATIFTPYEIVSKHGGMFVIPWVRPDIVVNVVERRIDEVVDAFMNTLAADEEKLRFVQQVTGLTSPEEIRNWVQNRVTQILLAASLTPISFPTSRSAADFGALLFYPSNILAETPPSTSLARAFAWTKDVGHLFASLTHEFYHLFTAPLKEKITSIPIAYSKLSPEEQSQLRRFLWFVVNDMIHRSEISERDRKFGVALIKLLQDMAMHDDNVLEFEHARNIQQFVVDATRNIREQAQAYLAQRGIAVPAEALLAPIMSTISALEELSSKPQLKPQDITAMIDAAWSLIAAIHGDRFVNERLIGGLPEVGVSPEQLQIIRGELRGILLDVAKSLAELSNLNILINGKKLADYFASAHEPPVNVGVIYDDFVSPTELISYLTTTYAHVTERAARAVPEGVAAFAKFMSLIYSGAYEGDLASYLTSLYSPGPLAKMFREALQAAEGRFGNPILNTSEIIKAGFVFAAVLGDKVNLLLNPTPDLLHELARTLHTTVVALAQRPVPITEEAQKLLRGIRHTRRQGPTLEDFRKAFGDALEVIEEPSPPAEPVPEDLTKMLLQIGRVVVEIPTRDPNFRQIAEEVLNLLRTAQSQEPREKTPSEVAKGVMAALSRGVERKLRGDVGEIPLHEFMHEVLDIIPADTPYHLVMGLFAALKPTFDELGWLFLSDPEFAHVGMWSTNLFRAILEIMMNFGVLQPLTQTQRFLEEVTPEWTASTLKSIAAGLKIYQQTLEAVLSKDNLLYSDMMQVLGNPPRFIAERAGTYVVSEMIATMRTLAEEHAVALLPHLEKIVGREFTQEERDRFKRNIGGAIVADITQFIKSPNTTQHIIDNFMTLAHYARNFRMASPFENPEILAVEIGIPHFDYEVAEFVKGAIGVTRWKELEDRLLTAKSEEDILKIANEFVQTVSQREFSGLLNAFGSMFLTLVRKHAGDKQEIKMPAADILEIISDKLTGYVVPDLQFVATMPEPARQLILGFNNVVSEVLGLYRIALEAAKQPRLLGFETPVPPRQLIDAVLKHQPPQTHRSVFAKLIPYDLLLNTVLLERREKPKEAQRISPQLTYPQLLSAIHQIIFGRLFSDVFKERLHDVVQEVGLKITEMTNGLMDTLGDYKNVPEFQRIVDRIPRVIRRHAHMLAKMYLDTRSVGSPVDVEGIIGKFNPTVVIADIIGDDVAAGRVLTQVPDIHKILDGLVRAAFVEELLSLFVQQYGAEPSYKLQENHPKPWRRLLGLEEEDVQRRVENTIVAIDTFSALSKEFATSVVLTAAMADWSNPHDVSAKQILEVVDALWSYALMREPEQRRTIEPSVKDVLVKYADIAKSYLDRVLSYGLLSVSEVREFTQRLNREITKIIATATKEGWAEAPYIERGRTIFSGQKELARLLNEIGSRLFTNALVNMSKRIATIRELKSISRHDISDAIVVAKTRAYFTPPVQEALKDIHGAFAVIYRGLPKDAREQLKFTPHTLNKSLYALMIRTMEELLQTWEAQPGSSTHLAIHSAMNNFFVGWMNYYASMLKDVAKFLETEVGKKTTEKEEVVIETRELPTTVNQILKSALITMKEFVEFQRRLRVFYDVMSKPIEEPTDILSYMADMIGTYVVEKQDIPPNARTELKGLLNAAAAKWEDADREHLEILKRSIDEGLLTVLITGQTPFVTTPEGERVVDTEKVNATLAHYAKVLQRFEQNAENERKAGNTERADYWERQAQIIRDIMDEIENNDLSRVGLVHLSESAKSSAEFKAFLELLREVFINALGTSKLEEEILPKIPKALHGVFLESARAIAAGTSHDTLGLRLVWGRQKGAALHRFLVGLSLIGAAAFALPYLPHFIGNILPALLHDVGRGIAQAVHYAMTPTMWYTLFASGLVSYLLRNKTSDISRVLTGALAGVSQWLTRTLPRIDQTLVGVNNDIVSFVRRNMGDHLAAIAHAVIGEMQVPAAWKNLALLPHLANQISQLRTQGTFPTKSKEPTKLAEEIVNYTLASAVLNQATALGAFIHDMARATENTLIQRVALVKFLQDPTKTEGVVLDFAVRTALKLLGKHGITALDKTLGSFSKRKPLKLSRIGYIEDPATGQRQAISLDVNNAYLTVSGQRKSVADMTLREVLAMGLGQIAGADLDALLNSDEKTFNKILKRIVANHAALLRDRIKGQLLAHLDDETRAAIKFISSYIQPVALNLMAPAKRPYLAAALATHHEVQAAFLIGLRYLQSLISHPYVRNLLKAAGYDIDPIVSEIETFWGGLRQAGVAPKLIEDIDRVMLAIGKEINDAMAEITAKSLSPQVAMLRIKKALERVSKPLAGLFHEAAHTRYTPLTKAFRGKVLPFLLGAPFLSLENDLKEAIVELRNEGFNQELFSVATSTFPEKVRNLPEIIAMEQTLRSGKVTPMQMLDALDYRIDALLKELAKTQKVKYETLRADFDTLLAALYIHSHTRMEPQHRVESIDDVFRKRLPQPVKSWIFDPSKPLGREAAQIRQKLYQLAFPYVVLLNYLVKGHGMKAYLGDLYNGIGPAFALTEERYVPQWGDASQKPQILIVDLIQDVFGRLPHKPPKQPFEFTRTGRGTVPFEDFRDAMRRAIHAFKTKQVIDKNRPLVEGVIAFMPPALKHMLAWQLANALSPMGITGYKKVPWTFEIGEDIAKAIEDMFDAAGNYYKTHSEALAKRQGDALDKLLAAFQTQVLWLNPRSSIRQLSSLFYAAAQISRDFNDPMAYYIVGIFYPRAINIIRALLKGDTSKLNDFERFVLEHSPEIQSRHLVTLRETLNAAQEVLEKLMARPEGAKLLETLLDPAASQADRDAAVQRLEELFVLGTDPAWWKEAVQKVKEWGFAMLRLNDEAAVLATKLAAIWMYLAHNDITGIPDEKTLFAALSYGSAVSEAIHSTPLEGFRPTAFRGSMEKGPAAWVKRAFFIPQVFSQFMVYTFAAADTFRRLLGSAYDAIFNKELPLRERITDLASALTGILMLQIGFAALNGFWMGLMQKPLEEQPLGTFTSEEEQKNATDQLMSTMLGALKSSLPKPLLLGVSYLLSLVPLRQRILQRTTFGTITERDLPPFLQFLNRIILSLTNAYTSFGNVSGVEENEGTSKVQEYFDKLLLVAPRDQIPGLVADTLQFLSLAASLRFPAASLYPAGLIGPATRVVASAVEGLPVPAQITETFGGARAGLVAQALAGTPAPGGYSELLSPTPRDIAFAVTTRSGEEMAFKFLDVTERYDVPSFVAELIAIARTARTPTIFKALNELTNPNFYISIKRPSATQVIPTSVSENHPMVASVTKLYDAMISPTPDKFIEFVKSDPIRFAWLTALFGYDYIMDRFSALSKPEWTKRLKDIGQLEVVLIGSGMKPELVSAIANIAQNSTQANIRLYLERRQEQVRQMQQARQVTRIREQIQTGRRGK